MSSPVLFQALPPLAPDEYRALEESITAHGIQVPILIDENGVVIDGHHRQKIASHLDIECPTIIKSGYTEAEKRTLALSLNIDRRHLNREQKRALIAESIKADPQLSDREHAKRTGSHHTTVGGVRSELEDDGDVAKLATRTDASGREQPASKPRPVVDPAPVDDRFISSDDLDELNAPPEPAPPKEKRRPLVDQFASAGWELRKAIERLERLAEDDRFNATKSKLAPHLRGHLTNAIEVCQDLLDHTNTHI